jgi:hypothetical protein
MSCSHGRRLWHCYPDNNGEDVVLRLKMEDEKAGIVNKDNKQDIFISRYRNTG